jgi:5-methylcytosine-specific restriction enzyme subunit McrC
MWTAPPRHVTALEYEALPVRDSADEHSITVAEADELSLIAERRHGFCERSYRTVRLAQYCGVVNLGTRTLEVLPKVGDNTASHARGILLRLLRLGGLNRGFRSTPAGQRLEAAPLLEIFIALYLESVTEILRAGLLRQYMHRAEDLRVIRGRIDLPRQFGVLFSRPDSVACLYDDHTTDNRWNRILKAALRRCRPWIIGADTQRRWVELMAAFYEVADVPVVPSDMKGLVFDRHAVRYRDAVTWARWILALLTPAMRAGADHAPALLFDMNLVFEQAVAQSLRGKLFHSHPRYDVSAQDRHLHLARRTYAAGRRAYRLIPDLVVREGPAVRLVADAKWKRVDVDRGGQPVPSRSDMYQMHAYASVYETERLALIYPAHDGVTAESSFRLPEVNGRRPVVSVVCVDVTQDHLPFTAGAKLLQPSDSP